MAMISGEPIRLEYSDGRQPVTSLAAVNAALAPVGARVWPHDLRAAPGPVRRVLRQASLSDAEIEQIKQAFLLPRERLLSLIAEAGRAPQLPEGGAMCTYVSPHDYWYPTLYLVEAGVDYGRFDRFHVNTDAQGTGVDEIMQILSGGGVRIMQRLAGDAFLTLHLTCKDEDTGWLVTYDGGHPHIGSLSAATAGTKVLMQVIGPERWEMRYSWGE